MGAEVWIYKGVRKHEPAGLERLPEGVTIEYIPMRGMGAHGYLDCSRLDRGLCGLFCFGDQQIFLNEVNVSKEIRSEEVGNQASVVAAYGAVREKLVALQRQMAASTDVIMDGRDIGTVVLPGAELKIYLTASSAVRADRRYKELQEKGIDCDREKIEEDIILRDKQDMNREISPLKQAEDAVYLDSSDMTIDEVVQEIITLAKGRSV